MYERLSWPDAADIYRQQRREIRALIDAASAELDDVGATPIPACPGWDVHALTAHLAGAPAALLARSYPGDDAEAWVAGHLAERAGRPAAQNLDEWDRVGADYDRLLSKNEPAWGALAYDAVVHEHDLREALGTPGNRAGRPVDYALDRTLAKLDGEASGRRVGVRVETSGVGWIIGDTVNTVASVHADSPWELVRLLGSRRNADQVAAATTGDVDVVIALLPWGAPREHSDG